MGHSSRGNGRPRVVALAAVAGIGFTVAIFVSGLAFVDQGLIDQAKLGILSGSLLAGLLGFFLYRFGPAPRSPEKGPASRICRKFVTLRSKRSNSMKKTALTLLVVALLVAACGDSEDTTTTAAADQPPETVVVEVKFLLTP